MADPRDELAYEAMANEPGLVPPREPLRIRVSPYDTPPPSETGWGGFGSGGRPTGRLFEPDLSQSPTEASFQQGIRATPWFSEFKQRFGEEPNLDDKDYDYRKAWAAGARPDVRDPGDNLLHWSSQFKGPEHPNRFVNGVDTITGQSAQPPKPQWQPGILSLGNVVRGIGSLVQGARDSFNAPSVAPQQAAAPPPARDPTAGPRQMFQQGYPSAPYSSMFKGPATTALEASGVPEFIESGKGYFNPESQPGEQQQRVQQQVQTGANVTANLVGTGVTGASVRGGTSLGIFGARMVQPEKRALAEAMQANGLPPNRVWKETGAMQGADKKWIGEASDLAARYKGGIEDVTKRIFDQKYPDRAGQYDKNPLRMQMAREDALLKVQGEQQLFLPDVLDHPELFKLYPELKQMPVTHDAFMQAQGGYLPARGNEAGKIFYREDDPAKTIARGNTFDTLLHEVQHAIAQIDGLARGTNPSRTLKPSDPAYKIYEKQMVQAPKNMTNEDLVRYQQQAMRYAGAKNYAGSAGEKLAELPPIRKDLTPEQAAAIYPGHQMKVPLEKQFVEFNEPVYKQGNLFGQASEQSQMGGVLNPAPREMQMSAGPSPLLRSPGKTMKEPAWQPVTPTPFLKEPQRTYSPGIYKNPKQIAEEAGAQTAAEHPALKELFGVTRDDLWQIGQQGRRQGNVDPQLWAPNKPGGSYVARNIMTPENAQRMIDPMVEARRFPALSKGMEAWYVMDPAFQRMVQLVGKEQAVKDYKRFNAIMTPFSSNSTVTSEINRGTAARMMADRGRFEEFARLAGTPVEKRGADFPPELRDVLPHLRHGGHIPPVERWLKTGEHGYAKETVKNPLYTLASGVPETGFQTKLPVPDAHLARASGAADVRTGTDPKGWGAYLGGTEYREFGPWFRENVAKPLGVEAVPGQGLMWGTFAPQTGVKTAIGAPKLEILSQLIWERAKKLGIDPKKLRDDVLMGKEHAVGLLTAGAGGAAGIGSLVDPRNYEAQ